MAILFDFYDTPSPDKDNGNKERKFHARVVGGQTIGIDTLVHHIHERSTLTKGDIKAVIEELGDELVYELADGNRVYLPGIGYFSLSLSAPSDTDPQTTRSQQIEIKKVSFRADQLMKDSLKNKAEFKRSKEKNHSTKLSKDEILTLLRDFFKHNAYLTRPQFEEITGFTRMTAQRHLKEMVEEGVLKKTNGEHLPIYLLGINNHG